MTKKGCTPVNIDNKGEAAFCCRQGIRYTCRRHQSNQWPSTMCALPRYIILHVPRIYSPSLSPNSPMPNGLWYKHSPLRKAKRHGTRYVRATHHLRTASVRFMQEESHNITSIQGGSAGAGTPALAPRMPVITEVV